MSRRSSEKVLADLIDAAEAAADLVARGRPAFDEDRLLRLAAETVVGRIGDAAKKLLGMYGDHLPSEIPWVDIVANRIVVDHSYHRIDYDTVWVTLTHDIPLLKQSLESWSAGGGLGSPSATPPTRDE